ncbi:Uncharacterized protein Adt_44067 [Abeliophyllum distichum]|uniref:Uncharacterized protein n=1 Tax=Abeliophyllum distichum TaxID=126358 RepID=A0ABD1P9W0_9LAMI
MTIIPLPYNSQFWRKNHLAAWIFHLQLNSGDSKSPAHSKYRVYPSIKPTLQRPQLQSTQQQPKPNFVTPYATLPSKPHSPPAPQPPPALLQLPPLLLPHVCHLRQHNPLNNSSKSRQPPPCTIPIAKNLD